MESVTPEAVKNGRSPLNEGYQTYVIDDAELDRISEVRGSRSNIFEANFGCAGQILCGQRLKCL